MLADSHLTTPLHLAAQSGSTRLARMLLESCGSKREREELLRASDGAGGAEGSGEEKWAGQGRAGHGRGGEGRRRRGRMGLEGKGGGRGEGVQRSEGEGGKRGAGEGKAGDWRS